MPEYPGTVVFCIILLSFYVGFIRQPPYFDRYVAKDINWVMGMEASSAMVLDEEHEEPTPADLNDVPFDKSVRIWLDDELVLADKNTTLGEILRKINEVYNEAFEAETVGSRFFEGFRHIGSKDYEVVYGD
ncbi:hypothetical protein VE03_10581 [Pseudogymnoascus sp. 23342-1-I1]|nr:hypothetical protein VE03_10581 [Pseudogymnoascus sp. 23342-1-I1]